jgi:endonuclease/exonuclease/phosphatase family metal-dependent hydrolase
MKYAGSCVALAAAVVLGACSARPIESDTATVTFRVATYNLALYDDAPGGVRKRLEAGDDKARRVAAVIQSVRPDVLLINELDYDGGESARLFVERYLGAGQFGREPIRHAYRFVAPVNTGVASGLDLDRDGRSGGPADAWGYGQQPGQYGMLVLSRYPIARARTFQNLPWAAMPGALAPIDPRKGEPFYADRVWREMRLSSKSHWDLALETPAGIVHLLASHPTPPVFDGPEDRNGRRNHDEIRFWADYVDAARARDWIVDDEGTRGGLEAGVRFVIAGDLNADPNDGASYPGAIAQLLAHPLIDSSRVPTSRGAVEHAQRTGEGNVGQRGDPAHDTGNFGARLGNYRIDYVLPSRNLRATDSGVFWPASNEPGHELIEASDHRLVWIDIAGR